jgi:hypothetical protein
MPRAGKGGCLPRPTVGDGCEVEDRPCDGRLGSGHVGGGEGGGRSSKKRGRGLGTMKSDDEIIDISDNVGEDLCGGGDVDGVNMSGDGVARTVRDRKGSVSDGADVGEGACKAGGTGEGRIEVGLDMYRGEGVCGEVFGRGGCLPGVIVTDGDGGMGNVRSDEPKRLEGVKRTERWGGAASEDIGACSRWLNAVRTGCSSPRG